MTEYNLNNLSKDILVSPLDGVEAYSIDNDSGTVPAGRYFIGDPCYTAGRNDKAWIEFVNLTYNDDVNFYGAMFDGYPVVALNTEAGDGHYWGDNGFGYGVDSGLIGLVHEGLIEQLELTEDSFIQQGSWFTFETPVTLTYDDGDLIFSSEEARVVISTGDPDDDEEYLDA